MAYAYTYTHVHQTIDVTSHFLSEWRKAPRGCSSNVPHKSILRHVLESYESVGLAAFLSTDARAAGEGNTGAPSPGTCYVCPALLQINPCYTTGYFSNGPSKSSGFWQLEYYQPYFDVDTKTVRPFLPSARSRDLK